MITPCFQVRAVDDTGVSMRAYAAAGWLTEGSSNFWFWPPSPAARRIRVIVSTLWEAACASDSGAMSRRNLGVDWGNDDELLARVLITSWTLATGRTLRAGVPPHSLSADELISFWADDLIAIP